jgi:hypothetical protein
MDREQRNGLVSLALAFALCLFGGIVGYEAGKDKAQAEIRFSFLPCGE